MNIPTTRFAAIRSNKGVGLVELMVGMVIALLSMIVIMQIFSQSEAQKRTSTSGNDAQTSGAVALYTLERDARMAGYGLAVDPLIRCPSIAVWRQSTMEDRQIRVSPFEVNPPVASVMAGDANSDVIAISFASSDRSIEGIPALQVVNPGDDFTIDSAAGFRTGDLVVGVLRTGAGPNDAQCALHEITNVPSGACVGDAKAPQRTLLHHTGLYRGQNRKCYERLAEFNRAGGIPGILQLTKTNAGALFNVGHMPINIAYSIRDKTLMMCDSTSTNCTVADNFKPIANDIVSLRAVYGKDTNNDGVADTWDRLTPTGVNWFQVVSVRVALVARSAIKEKADAAGVCEQTTNPARPDNRTWFGQAIPGAGIDVSDPGDAEWGCYRYKLFETVVPMKNLFWRPTNSLPPALP
jgi:type IV pilus assembly protein PilW